jgi:hypothetical protein
MMSNDESNEEREIEYLQLLRDRRHQDSETKINYIPIKYSWNKLKGDTVRNLRAVMPSGQLKRPQSAPSLSIYRELPDPNPNPNPNLLIYGNLVINKKPKNPKKLPKNLPEYLQVMPNSAPKKESHTSSNPNLNSNPNPISNPMNIIPTRKKTFVDGLLTHTYDENGRFCTIEEARERKLKHRKQEGKPKSLRVSDNFDSNGDKIGIIKRTKDWTKFRLQKAVKDCSTLSWKPNLLPGSTYAIKDGQEVLPTNAVRIWQEYR